MLQSLNEELNTARRYGALCPEETAMDRASEASKLFEKKIV